MAEIRREYNFRSEKIIFDNKKVILASLNTIPGVNLERNESFPREKTNFMTSYL